MKKLRIIFLMAILMQCTSIYAEEFKEILPIEQRIIENSKNDSSEKETVKQSIEQFENSYSEIKDKVEDVKNSQNITEQVKDEVKNLSEKKDNFIQNSLNKIDQTRKDLTRNNFFQEKPVITKENFTGEVKDLAEKRVKNGIVYAEDETKPYTGKFALFLGDFIEYIETYKDGVLEGPKTWYSESGQKVLEEQYKDNKVVGDQKAFYENGKLKSVVNYKNGRINGIVTYSKDGKILHKDDFKNGTGTWKYFWENGNVLEEGKYKNWIKDGIWKKYKENGEVDSITEYKNGRLVETTWN